MWKKLTTYLTLISTLLVCSMFFCSFASIIGPEGSTVKIMYYEKMPYLIMMIMLLTGGLFSILTHRHPFLQARVCMLTALMLIGFQIWLGIDFFNYRNDMVFSLTMLFPLLTATLEIIASRRALIDGVTLQALKLSKRKAGVMTTKTK